MKSLSKILGIFIEINKMMSNIFLGMQRTKNTDFLKTKNKDLVIKLFDFKNHCKAKGIMKML